MADPTYIYLAWPIVYIYPLVYPTYLPPWPILYVYPLLLTYVPPDAYIYTFSCIRVRPLCPFHTYVPSLTYLSTPSVPFPFILMYPLLPAYIIPLSCICTHSHLLIYPLSPTYLPPLTCIYNPSLLHMYPPTYLSTPSHLHIYPTRPPGGSVDAGMWRDYIGLLGRSTLPEAAEQALIDMQKRDGVKPCEGCYLRVVRAHCELGAWRRAVEVGEKLRNPHFISFHASHPITLNPHQLTPKPQ